MAKSLKAKGLQTTAGKGPQTHRRPDPPPMVPPVAVQVTTGPLMGPDGAVRVDAGRCPALYAALTRGAGRVAAERRTGWGAVVDARAHGHSDQADTLAAGLLGVAPPAAPRDLTPEQVIAKAAPGTPAEVTRLLAELTRTKEKSAACKIRAALRKLGHVGGLRTLGAVLILLVFRGMLWL